MLILMFCIIKRRSSPSDSRIAGETTAQNNIATSNKPVLSFTILATYRSVNNSRIEERHLVHESKEHREYMQLLTGLTGRSLICSRLVFTSHRILILSFCMSFLLLQQAVTA